MCGWRIHSAAASELDGLDPDLHGPYNQLSSTEQP